MMYNIGSKFYIPKHTTKLVEYPCPTCGGTKTLKVTLYNGTEYIVDCDGCSKGYLGPSGAVSSYQHVPHTEDVEITGINTDATGVKYKISSLIEYEENDYDGSGNTRKRYIFQEHHYPVTEANLYIHQKDALEQAEVMAAEYNAEQEKALLQKEKPNKTWGWHITYHKREIKDAERKIEYHSKKLGISQGKKKNKED